VEEPVAPAAVDDTRGGGEPLSVRVQRLEDAVATLANELRELKGKLGE
jgi:hypothetical protein